MKRILLISLYFTLINCFGIMDVFNYNKINETEEYQEFSADIDEAKHQA